MYKLLDTFKNVCYMYMQVMQCTVTLFYIVFPTDATILDVILICSYLMFVMFDCFFFSFSTENCCML